MYMIKKLSFSQGRRRMSGICPCPLMTDFKLT